jgi:2-polyprenyl-3-methyl-5-hydroxy-6-metoxy-1,4-benzoquinol methylase
MQDFSEQTRAIYHAQHQRIVADDRAMTRFIGMFSHEYFGLPVGWFEGKRVVDAGCGDTAKLLIALYQMGCRDLHGFDLGEDFIPVATTSAASRGATGITFKSGNLLSPPYEPEGFDFVSCHGVMVHLNSLDEVRTAFAELAKLVKKGGGALYGVRFCRRPIGGRDLSRSSHVLQEQPGVSGVHR